MPHTLTAAAVLTAALSIHAAAAHAQAPGDCACAAPPDAVVVVAEAPRRFGVSLRLSGLGLHPTATPEDHADFSGGGLAVSYRINRRWGIEVAAEQLAEQAEGAPTGRELQAGSLSAIFHLRPGARWDGYLIAGLDAVAEVTDRSADPTSYVGAHVGAGLERRFGRFAVSAELRLLGLSPAQRETAGSMEPARYSATDTMDPAVDDGLSGGQVSLAGTYYF